MVAAAVRTVFAQPDAGHARRRLVEVADMLRGQFPDVAAMLTDSADDMLAYAFPQAHWRKVWSMNSLERLNSELKRRTKESVDRNVDSLDGFVIAPEVNLDVRYTRNPAVLWRSTSRGPVLVSPGHQRPELLGGLAAVVWEVCDSPLSAPAVAMAVSRLVPGAGDPSSALQELLRADLLHTMP